MNNRDRRILCLSENMCMCVCVCLGMPLCPADFTLLSLFLDTWNTLMTSYPLAPFSLCINNALSHKQRQLTPCFRLSLTWSATSDTITSAAVDKKLQLRARLVFSQIKYGQCSSLCDREDRDNNTLCVFILFRIRGEIV